MWRSVRLIVSSQSAPQLSACHERLRFKSKRNRAAYWFCRFENAPDAEYGMCIAAIILQSRTGPNRSASGAVFINTEQRSSLRAWQVISNHSRLSSGNLAGLFCDNDRHDRYFSTLIIPVLCPVFSYRPAVSRGCRRTLQRTLYHTVFGRGRDPSPNNCSLIIL